MDHATKPVTKGRYSLHCNAG